MSLSLKQMPLHSLLHQLFSAQAYQHKTVILQADGGDKPALESPSGLSTRSFQSARAFVGDAARQSWGRLDIPAASTISNDRRDLLSQRMPQQTIEDFDFGEEQVEVADESANSPASGNATSRGKWKGMEGGGSKDFRVAASGKSGTSIRHHTSDSR